jgi:hypothetical protein
VELVIVAAVGLGLWLRGRGASQVQELFHPPLLR